MLKPTNTNKVDFWGLGGGGGGVKVVVVLWRNGVWERS
jgi:hypothetical protein